MTDTQPVPWTFTASDGYPLAVLTWPPLGAPRARVVVVHGVQSHAGWYHGLGRRLAGCDFEVHFPDRRGSGANRKERGHAASARRLVDDLAEFLSELKGRGPRTPLALAGISWGGKLAVIEAGRHPDRVDALALICPGLHPRVGVGWGEKVRIAAAVLTGRASKVTFPIPLNDPALFTASPEGQAFIAGDPHGLRVGTAGLLAASFFLDRMVAGVPGKIRQPTLLMLAGLDRIADNAKTRAYFDRIAGVRKEVIEYPEGHHTLEFEPDPSRYAADLADWLGRTLADAPPDRLA